MKIASNNELQKFLNLRREFRKPGYISLHPIQRGGILSQAAREALLEFGDGYSTCDFCPPDQPRLDAIKNPPISDFYQELASFLGMDLARVVTRCREAKFICFRMLGKPGDYVIIDSLAHYSTYLAAELAGLRIMEVPHSGYPQFRLDLDGYAQRIEQLKSSTGKYPAAVLITHVDYLYGNLSDAAKVAKLAHEYELPCILNAAYSAGVMPVDAGQIGADIIVSSGHKSWGAAAPTGILALTQEMAKRILARASIKGDWSGRSFETKELALLGCTVMGAPLLSLMAAFPGVVKRVRNWDEEIAKARYLVEQLERIQGTRQLGIKPKQHTLIHIESQGFYQISKTHKRRGYFLYEELRSRGIVGIQPGLSKHFKLNTYGLSWDQIRYVAQAFQQIALKYGLELS